MPGCQIRCELILRLNIVENINKYLLLNYNFKTISDNFFKIISSRHLKLPPTFFVYWNGKNSIFSLLESPSKTQGAATNCLINLLITQTWKL